jgi:hypothetical protein
MTFKALKKGFSLEITQAQSRLFERLRLKPFWIWDTVEHKKADIETRGDCCLNYIIGLPTKDGRCIDPDNKSDLKIADHKYQAYDLLL